MCWSGARYSAVHAGRAAGVEVQPAGCNRRLARSALFRFRHQFARTAAAEPAQRTSDRARRAGPAGHQHRWHVGAADVAGGHARKTRSSIWPGGATHRDACAAVWRAARSTRRSGPNVAVQHRRRLLALTGENGRCAGRSNPSEASRGQHRPARYWRRRALRGRQSIPRPLYCFGDSIHDVARGCH